MARLPPGSSGLPYLGESVALFRDPLRYGEAHCRKYGPIFHSRFLGKPMVVLLSAEGQRYVLARNAKNFLWQGGYGMLGQEVFGDALFLIDGERHDFLRKMMTPAFRGKEYPQYLVGMNQAIDANLDAWGTVGRQSFYEEARKLTFALSTSLLVGMEIAIDRERLRQLFTRLLAGASSLTHSRLPWTTYARSVQARREIEPILLKFIAERRQKETTDALGRLIAARDENGNCLSDRDLIGQAITLIFAGYDSTASTLTWMMVELLRQPELMERARIAAGMGDPAAPVTMDDLRGRPFLDALIQETLRLHPTASVIMRGAREAFTFGGYDVPAGWMALLIPAYTQRHPDYFSDPNRFDPERFLPPRDEDAAHPYAFVGFGGGPRNCIGSGIAQVELKALLVKLLRRFTFQLVPGQNLAPIWLPLTRPKSAVQVVYRQHS